jgi:adenine deaminase
VVLEGELADFSVGDVYRAGNRVASKGRLLETPARGDDSPVLDTVRLAPLGPHDLDLKLKSENARVITIRPGSLVTGDVFRRVNRDVQGRFIPDSGADLLKLVVVERHKSTGRIGIGILEGYGLRGGAAASSIAHDSHNLIAVGDDDAAILSALRALATSGGGISLAAAGGELLGVLPLPLGGLMSDQDPRTTAARLDELIVLAHDRLGVRMELDPFMPLSFLALPVIPDLKLTARGLFDVRKFEFVSVDIPQAAVPDEDRGNKV